MQGCMVLIIYNASDTEMDAQCDVRCVMLGV